MAGRGADLFIIDDPHSEQDAKLGKGDVFLPAWEWFQSGTSTAADAGGSNCSRDDSVVEARLNRTDYQPDDQER